MACKRGKAMENLIGILLCCCMVLAETTESLPKIPLKLCTESTKVHENCYKYKLLNGTEPAFTCTQQLNQTECMDLIESGMADFNNIKNINYAQSSATMARKREKAIANLIGVLLCCYTVLAETTEHLPKIPLKLCTASTKVYEDCLKYKVTNGTEPAFTCTQQANQTGCMDLIESGMADITNIDIKNVNYAQSKNLKPVAFPEHEVVKSLIVVNNISKYKSFSDLKDSFGCFSEFGNIAYMSFLVKLKEVNLLSKLVSYDSGITSFLSDSCAPGVLAVDHNELKMDKLCSCRSASDTTYRSCNLNSDNQWYGNEGALSCLQEMKGFAVITTEGVQNDKSVTVLCKNGSLAAYPGLEVDDNCYLSIVIANEFVMRKTDTNWTNILTALKEIPAHFNISLINPVKTYIDLYNSTTNEEFYNKTINWDHTIYKDIISFKKIYNDYNDNADTVNSAPSIPTAFNLLIILSMLYAVL